jgi:glycosyltransferase involved in cell wall biosynthesis
MLGSTEKHPKAVDRKVADGWVRDGVVEILGTASDVRPAIADADCIVLPSYREGLPRVLLEAGAMAKPVIATDVPGCRQVVENGSTGLLCEARSAESLARAMLALLDMDVGARFAMGRRARKRVEREFSEARVVAAYIEALAGGGLRFEGWNAG